MSRFFLQRIKILKTKQKIKTIMSRGGGGGGRGARVSVFFFFFTKNPNLKRKILGVGGERGVGGES